MPPVISQAAPRLLVVLATLGTMGCHRDELPVSPAGALAAYPVAAGAVHAHTEFEVPNNFDIPLTCLDGEMTHWEGTVRVVVHTTATPKGTVHERIYVSFLPGYFVRRANGDEYWPIGPFQIHEVHQFGPISVIAGTASGAWRSANGDVLALGFHVQLVYDRNGNPVIEKFTGACP